MRKFGCFGTYVAMFKAYCSMNVLLLPKAFANGGYVLSPSALLVATIFEAMCAVRLSMIARQFKIYNYSLLMEKALGPWGLMAGRICVSLAHWQFSIA